MTITGWQRRIHALARSKGWWAKMLHELHASSATTAHLRYGRPPEHRFWAKVALGDAPKHAPRLGECWVWNGHKNEDGYGNFGLDGGLVKAHRFAYVVVHGATETHVLHRCDNPACVRPDHLFTGTQRDNVADMEAKGRAVKQAGDLNGAHTKPETRPRGERHGMARLSDLDVRTIRSQHEAGATQAALCREWRTAQSTMHGILSRRSRSNAGVSP